MRLQLLQLYSSDFPADDGDVKFKTFRGLMIGALCLVGAAGSILLYSTCGGDPPAQPSTTAAADAPKPSTPTQKPADKPAVNTGATTPAQTGDGGTEIRPLDKQTIERMQQGFPGDKVKDAFKGSAKVNLYKEPDGTRRVKIDLDRDEKWDEKWTFETKDGADKIKRQVATKDDENYDVEYRLDSGRWVPKK